MEEKNTKKKTWNEKKTSKEILTHINLLLDRYK